MAEITKTLSITGEESEVETGSMLVARSRGYTKTIKDGEGNDIDNPRSVDDYVLDGIKYYLKQTAKIQLSEEMQAAAAAQAEAAFDANTSTIVVTLE